MSSSHPHGEALSIAWTSCPCIITHRIVLRRGRFDSKSVNVGLTAVELAFSACSALQ